MTYSGRWRLTIFSVVAGGLAGAAVVASPLLIVALATAFATATLLVVASRAVLWALALFLFVALPVAFLPVPDILVTVTPPTIIMFVLLVRLLIDGRGLPNLVLSPVAILVLAFGGCLALTVFVSDYRTITVGWFFNYTCLVLLPALLATAETRIRGHLSTVWVVLAAVLGLYATVEAFILQANPIAEAFLGYGEREPIDQVWSVYRATTILGHPVSNGSFFAIAVPLALGVALHRHSKLAVLAALLAAGGVVASGTRAAFAAMLLGAAITLLIPRKGWITGQIPRMVQLGGILGICAVMFIGWSYLSVRETSGEGQGSSAFRSAQVPIAMESVRDSPLLGVGPGAASFSHESLLARIGGAGAFESYWLELVVGAGLIGLLLGGLVLACAVAAAVRSRRMDIAGAVVAWVVGATFVNAMEGGRSELFVLGVVLAMAFSGDGPESGKDTRSPRHTSRKGSGNSGTRRNHYRSFRGGSRAIGPRHRSASRGSDYYRVKGNLSSRAPRPNNVSAMASGRHSNCATTPRKTAQTRLVDNGGAGAPQEME